MDNLCVCGHPKSQHTFTIQDLDVCLGCFGNDNPCAHFEPSGPIETATDVLARLDAHADWTWYLGKFGPTWYSATVSGGRLAYQIYEQGETLAEAVAKALKTAEASENGMYAVSPHT